MSDLTQMTIEDVKCDILLYVGEYLRDEIGKVVLEDKINKVLDEWNTRSTSQEAEELLDKIIDVAHSVTILSESNELIDLRSRLLALCAGRELVEWQPIGTAPKDGTIFLAITSYGLQCTMRFNGECFVRNVTCRRCDGMGLGDLTHWMPIPALPKEDR